MRRSGEMGMGQKIVCGQKGFELAEFGRFEIEEFNKLHSEMSIKDYVA